MKLYHYAQSTVITCKMKSHSLQRGIVYMLIMMPLGGIGRGAGLSQHWSGNSHVDPSIKVTTTSTIVTVLKNNKTNNKQKTDLFLRYDKILPFPSCPNSQPK